MGFLKGYKDKKITAILILTYTAFRTVNLLSNVVIKLTYPQERQGISWQELFFNGYLIHLAFMLPFLPLIVIITKFFIKKKLNSFSIFGIHLMLSFLFKPVLFMIPTTIFSFLQGTMINVEFFLRYSRAFTIYADNNFLIYFALVAIAYTYFTFEQLSESKILQQNLEQQLSKAKLESLKSQIQPHFIFNTLNNIHSLMDINIDKSKRMVINFSDILRDILNNKDNNLIELTSEVEVLDKYLNIIRVRFEDDLTVIREIDENAKECLVPNLVVQQLVENSVKHGYDTEHLKLTIWINISKENDRLKIEVKNDGKLLQDSQNNLSIKGNGLNNITERLKTLFVSDFEFTVYNKNGLVFNTIKIPALTSKASSK